VGLGGAVIVLIFTLILTSFLGLHYIISTIIAFELSMIWGFYGNDKWTFSTIKKTSKPYLRFVKYNGLSLIGLGIIQAVMITLTEFFSMHYTPSQSIAIIIAFLFNFIASKKISFRN
jgi:putative flippase GtrA